MVNGCTFNILKDNKMNTQLIQIIKYNVSKLVAKYPFVKAYMDFDNNVCRINFEVNETEIGDNHPYYSDRCELCNLVSLYNASVLFTTNEELFKLSDEKIEIEPFNMDKDLTMKNKIKLIGDLINDICTKYGVEDVCIENIYHPLSYNGDGTPVIIPLCRVKNEKSGLDGNSIIEIHYRYYDEDWRGTHLSEHNNTYNAQRSADSIIDALYNAQLRYYKQHELLMYVKKEISDNCYDRMIFTHLFRNDF